MRAAFKMATTMEKDDTGILQTFADLVGAKEPVVRLLVTILISKYL